jgi:large subunit ribosomal protein L18
MKRFTQINNQAKSLKNQYRLAIFKSNKNIYAQIINDITSRTLVSCSTLDKTLNFIKLSNLERAALVGQTIALRALNHQILTVSLDLRNKKYAGCLKSFAEGTKLGGLRF